MWSRRRVESTVHCFGGVEVAVAAVDAAGLFALGAERVYERDGKVAHGEDGVAMVVVKCGAASGEGAFLWGFG